MILRLSLAAAALMPVAALAGSEPDAGSPPAAQFDLPAGVPYPEGVAYDAAHHRIYAGSALTGALVQIDAVKGTGRVIVPAGRIAPAGSTFPAMLGMKVDRTGRLWIAGGRTGLVTLVDPAKGRVIQQEKVPDAPGTLLNDLVVIGDTAYVTDTFYPMLWRIKAGHKPERWIDLAKSPIQFADGPNLNGIAATADGRALIVIQMNKGKLFRVDTATRAIVPIDIGTVDVTGSDGLWLEGSTLYVVRQWAGQVLRFQLDATLSKARLLSRYHDRAFVYPATAARVGSDLVIANSQFNRHDAGEPTTTFGLLRIPFARIAKGN